MSERRMGGYWRGEMSSTEKERALWVRREFKEALKQLGVPPNRNPGLEIIVNHPLSNEIGRRAYYPQIHYVQIELFKPDEIPTGILKEYKEGGLDSIQIHDAFTAAHEARHVQQRIKCGLLFNLMARSCEDSFQDDANNFALEFVKSQISKGKYWT